MNEYRLASCACLLALLTTVRTASCADVVDRRPTVAVSFDTVSRAAKSDYERHMEEGDRNILASQAAFMVGDISGRITSAKDALRCYQEAEAARSGQNLDAIYGEGFALSQMGAYKRAIEKFNDLRGRGYLSPNLDYAYGVALVHSSFPGTKRFLDGIDLLKKYAKDGTDKMDAVNYPYVAAATYLVGQATHLIKPNAVNSPAAAPPVPPTSRNDQGEWTPGPVAVALGSGIGFNDNLITLGRQFPLPRGVPRKSALFEESTFQLTRDSTSLKMDSAGNNLKDDILLTYLFQADEFDGFSVRDLLQNTVSAGYTKSFTPAFAGILKASDQSMFINQELTGNMASLQTAMRYRPVAPLTTQLSYFLLRADGYVDATPLTNPSGFSHRVEFEQDVDLLTDRFDFSSILTLQVIYAHQWIKTKGIETKQDLNDLTAKMTWKILHRYANDNKSFVRSISLVATEDWTPDRYLHDSFPSETAVDRFALEQHTNKIVVSLSIGMWYDKALTAVPDSSRLQAVMQYQHTSRDANVAAKAYDQNMLIASLKLNF